ncbi:MAG: hypothetical protein WA231_22635 [Methylocella sp.]
MSKNPQRAGSDERKDGLELKPDGWAQFERAVDAAVKGGPKHRSKQQQKKQKSKPEPGSVKKKVV